MKKIILVSSSLLFLTSCIIDSSVLMPKKSPAPTLQPLKDLPVSRVQVIPENLIIEEGEKGKFTGSVIYSDDSINSAIKWSSSDTTIATVNPDSGEVSAISVGNVTILAISQTDSSKRFSVTVTVRKK
ncbi:MAG: Ig-like domain-containing protein [Cyanobacteriota bacterium]